MSSYYEFDSTDAFTTGALGEPGQRTFVLQVRAEGQRITIKCEKEQVAAMLQNLLKIADAEMPKYLDATDGLAAAMCHYFQYRGDVIPETTKGVSGWKAFAAKNPDRIKG